MQKENADQVIDVSERWGLKWPLELMRRDLLRD